MSTLVERLKQAKALITDPRHWCKRSFATDGRGNRVEPDDEAACHWCAYGALSRALAMSIASDAEFELFYNTPEVAMLQLACRSQNRVSSVVDLNDAYGHAAVLQLYDEAIELARRKQKEPSHG